MTPPYYILRYEDLVSERKNALLEMSAYFAGLEKIDEKSLLYERIQFAIDNEEKMTYYKPKFSTFNQNMNRYDQEDIDLICTELRPYLIFFGYVKHPLCKYSFHDLGVLSEEEEKEVNGFEKCNAANKKVNCEFPFEKILERGTFNTIALQNDEEWKKQMINMMAVTDLILNRTD